MRALLLFALIACRSSSDKLPDKTGSATPGSDKGATTDKQERAAGAVARVVGIEPRLATLRALPFKQQVPAAYQSADDFKAFVRREVGKDLPADKSKRMSAAYLHLGLLAKPVDLATASIDAVSSQAAAYYDPQQKKFFIVAVPKDDLILDTMSAHELTHGLQDQNFDIAHYLAPKPPLDDDAQFARQFVTEGDATLSMLVYMAASATGSFDAASVMSVLELQIDKFASLDVLSADSTNKASDFKDIDPDIARSMEMVNQLPPIIMRPMLESYMKGSRLALVAYKNGGWKRVDDLYVHPPDSTEQVLHPMTKLIPKREPPIAVTLPALPGEEITSNVLGELQLNVYFSLWTKERAMEAAEGWGGDRYTVVKRPDGSLLGAIATAWDTAADAKQFADAYEASFAKRFPARDRKHAVKLDGTHVFVLDGDDDPTLLASLVSGTTFH